MPSKATLSDRKALKTNSASFMVVSSVTDIIVLCASRERMSDGYRLCLVILRILSRFY